MSWLSELFGGGKQKIRQVLQEGGVVIDLRTAYEFDQGHIPRSLNIPVDRISVNIVRIRDLGRPIVLCCGNGTQCRDASAILKRAGIERVYNGGSWQSVLKLVRR
jgi:phage shock protein E